MDPDFTPPGVNAARPEALIVRTAGTNCDTELARAFELAGAAPRLIHLDTLCRDPAPLDRARLIGFPGGFSYGDDVASGRIFAMRVRHALADPIRRAVAGGACVIGVCNGFQVLVQAGLLPGIEPGFRRAALLVNSQGRFVDDWVPIRAEEHSPCVWTRRLASEDHPAFSVLPVANGEGRFFAEPDAVQEMQQRGLIALRYAEPFNGSVGDIAGICDPTGRIFGLMPHPERYLEWSRHPRWPTLPGSHRDRRPIGLRMFENAVEAVSASVVR
ncbi:MAG: phosphoribosylformylglycinamidine synthase subunit PurQ [Phycisphaerales bacterium]